MPSVVVVLFGPTRTMLLEIKMLVHAHLSLDVVY